MEMDTITSRITLGILVLQDLWAIGFLALQPDLTNLKVMALILSAGKASVLVFCSWCCARFGLPIIFLKAAKRPELMLILAMAWCFAVCSLADFLGLSLEMGALIAGVSIASFPYKLDVAAKISSLRDFFITLFFVGLGLQITMPTSKSHQRSHLCFYGYQPASYHFPVLHFLKYGNRVSLVPALNLGQLSEFSLVLTSLGISMGRVMNFCLPSFIARHHRPAFLCSHSRWSFHLSSFESIP